MLTAVLLFFCVGISAEESASGSFGADSGKVSWGNCFAWSYDAESKTMKIFDGIDGLDTATFWNETTVCNETGMTMKEWKAHYASITEHIEVDTFGKHNSATLYADWTGAKSIHFASMVNLRVDSSSIGLFSGCTSVTKVWSGKGQGTDDVIDLSTWRVRNSESPANSFKNLLSGCSSAKKVILPTASSDTTGVAFTTIDATAFAGCTSLESIVVGATVTTIESGSFEGCPNALIDASANETVAAYMEANPSVGAPVTGTYAGTANNCAMDWSLLNGRLTLTVKSNATQIYLSNNAKAWADFTGTYGAYVKEFYIELADGVNVPYKMMSNEANQWSIWGGFNQLPNCKKVVLPGHIKEYAGRLWYNAKSLTTYGPVGTPEGTIDLSGVVKWSYDMTSMLRNNLATTVILPNKATPAKLTGTVTTPFTGSKITNVIIPENVTTIPADFFSECTITNVTFEGSAENIASVLQSMPFADSTSLTFNVKSKEAGEVVRALYPLATVNAKTVESGMTFDGWSIRVKSYNGLRGIMYFDNNKVNEGFELVEYGAVVTASKNKKGDIISADGTVSDKAEKIIVYKDGEIVNKILDYSTDERTYFAVTIVNFTANWTSDVYMCGYEMWRDVETGEIKVITTDYATDPAHDSSYADTNIYEISLGMYKSGAMNSKIDTEGVVFDVLKNGGAVKLTNGTDYNVEADAVYPLDYSKNMILADIPLAAVSVENGVVTFTDCGATYSVFEDGSGYFILFRGNSEIPSIPVGCYAQYAPKWYTELEYSSVSTERPQPVINADIFSKITSAVIDNGITAVGDRALAGSNITSLVCAETVTRVGESAFDGIDGVNIGLTPNLTFYGAGNGTIKSENVGIVKDSYVIDINKSGDIGLIYSLPAKLTANKTAVVSFKAYVENAYTTVKVSVLDSAGTALRSYSYSLSSAWSEISMPLTANGTETTVKFEFGTAIAKVHIGEISVYETEKSLYDAPTGSYMLKSSEWEAINIPYSGESETTSKIADMSHCRDVIVSDGYIYAIGDGNLYIYRANGLNPELVFKQENIGALRQMIMTDDGKGLIITARASGVFVFDVSNPINPVLASRIDAAEHATGIDTSGDYCYIADRMFGLGIVNISDLYNPVVTSYISVGECQDVAFYNGYVYCGCWGWCAIEIVDVRNPDAPKYVKELALSGRGDGIAIADGVLYAATGHYFRYQSLGTEGYGLGNGMDVFDVTDPANPKKISVARSDGACYYGSPDLWRVTLSGNYAFLSDCFSGLYVYDMTNTKLPRRVAQINIQAKNGEDGYRNLDSSNAVMLPFDTTQVRNFPIVDCDMADGYLYIANYDAGLYIYKTDLASEASKNENGEAVTDPNYDLSAWADASVLAKAGLSNASVFKTKTQIWEVVEHNGYLYVAAGTGGIYVLDTDMKVLNNIPTHDITMAIDIGEDGRVYTAESAAGLCIYEFDPEDNTKLNLIGQYKTEGIAFCDITVAPGSKYVLVQKGSASSLIDIRDLDNIKRVSDYREYTMVYQHQITDKAVNNRYLMVVAATGNPSALLDFGENGSYDVPKITYWVSGIEQGSGVCSDGNAFFGVAKNIYTFAPTISGLTSSKVTASGNPASTNLGVETGGGVPNICGDYLFLRYRRNGVYSIYKFADGDHTKAPTLIGKYNLENKAHPSATIVVGEKAYVALGYAGLASFDLPVGN